MDATNPALRALVLRLDAPLMSFGGVVVDEGHPTLRFPIRSMLAGLVANAMGCDRSECDALDALQDGFQFGSRWDVAPQLLRDYHNVALGSYKMSRKAWRHDGTLAERGGASGKATHQTQRYYWADGVLTAVLLYARAEHARRAALALRAPARPLFLGRKTCVPAAPLYRALIAADSVGQALASLPVLAIDVERRNDSPRKRSVPLEADLPDTDAALASGRAYETVDVPARLDHHNRIHTGTERRVRTLLTAALERAQAMED